MTLKICAVFLCCVTVIIAVKLPNYFNKCSLSDPNIGECIRKSGNQALPTFLKGDKTIRVVDLTPLVVPKIHLEVGNNLKIDLTDSSIYGLETAEIVESRWNVKDKRLDSIVSLDHSHLIGQYDIEGRILILPINGHGPCNITFVKPIFKYYNEFEIKTKNNKNYYQIVKHGLTYETERAYFKLDNLFNGDPRLGQEMNRFLDENWVEVNKELGARVGDALSEIFSGIIQEFYNRVPENELFLN